ncbi:hypothetical protein BJ138DRAFT_1123599 [Hygrophoropsis aurantiaca]|uniref:Uncharacterized protein n=1 Tax=Hygrophoropsis aurantiaca TaxID=72124 RepID=A0ACB8ALS3_9AGAM|nr:hypothetical protein BJ138DRAFT_1123599 [Hygrophoropsis aurantiaca]
MSHFAGLAYHTMPSYSAQRAAHPITPPETDAESIHARTFGAGSLVPPVVDLEHTVPSRSLAASPERSRLQPRRTSTLSYQNSANRDSRERPVQRSPKNLIILLPPPDFPLDQGQLGNVLSTGPRHRLSQGILMPLFPSMYGQLTAIAREFNFPSTVGLCLYLHITDNGVTITPRISDDSWQYLWGHLFEARSPSTGYQQLPISGHIEFDIDLVKARWFDTWVSASSRDLVDTVTPFGHSQGASVHHWRGDSRTTFAEEHVSEDRWEAGPSTSRQGTTRHVPRKLSLVDRLEILSTQPDASKPIQRPESPPVALQSTRILSPIPQSANPLTVRTELQQRVNSWRASALLDPASMAEAYQPVPDVKVNEAAEAMDEYPLDNSPQEELNLADYSWSLTSAGPPSYLPDSPLSPYRLPSVHLDRRLQGSVLLTPTTVTSWGPSDNDWISVISNIDRLPSPDIAQRMRESVPLTPVTATSWGPLDDDRSSIISNIDRLPSPDIGERMVEDSLFPSQKHLVPWQMVWPYWSAEESTPRPSLLVQLKASGGLDSQYPQLIIYPAVYPHFTIYPALDITSEQPTTARQSRGYPFIDIYPAAYPHFNIYPPVVFSENLYEESRVVILTERQVKVELTRTYPLFNLYPAQYPFNLHSIYPAPDSELLNLSPQLSSRYPWLDIYPSVYPFIAPYPTMDAETNQPTKSRTSQYPDFDIYPGVTFEFTSTEIEQSRIPDAITTSLSAVYPCFDIYPSGYPWNLNKIYPALTQVEDFNLSVSLTSQYPQFNIYPSVYPFVEPYPQMITTESVHFPEDIETTSAIALTVGYPGFDLYPAVYPHFDLYPAKPLASYTASTQRIHLPNIVVSLTKDYPYISPYPAAYPKFDVYPPKHSAPRIVDLDVRLENMYPSLVIYPPVYPHFDIYPRIVPVAHPGRETTKYVVDVRLQFQYPSIILYPAVYPHFDLYPGVAQSSTNESIAVLLEAAYPALVIYPPVYPCFDLYPGPSAAMPAEMVNIVVQLSITYPSIVIYPPVYPHFDLYPGPSALMPSMMDNIVVQLPITYPSIVIYYSVYPHFDIYPGSAANLQLREECSVQRVYHYPILDIYPAVYPHFDLYPGPAANLQLRKDDLTTKRVHRYPMLDIYPAVYPHFDLYPALLVVDSPDVAPVQEISEVPVRLQAKYPVFDLFPAVYPYFDLYGRNGCESDQIPTISCQLPSRYPYLELYRPVYPHIEIYPSIINPKSRHPNGRQRKLHAELVVEVSSKGNGKMSRESFKSHHQLHTEIFRDGVVWTPSGYAQDLARMHEKKPETVGPRPRPPPLHDVPNPRPLRSRSGTVIIPSPSGAGFRMVSPPQQQVPAMPPLRVRSPVLSTPSPSTSTTPSPRSSGSRLSQAVKSFGASMIPGVHRRPSNGALNVSEQSDHRERAKERQSPTRGAGISVDRRSSMITPPLSHHHGADQLNRAHSSSHRRESLVLQRARAYDQSTTATVKETRSSQSTKATISQFPMPPLPPMPKVRTTSRSERPRYPSV